MAYLIEVVQDQFENWLQFLEELYYYFGLFNLIKNAAIVLNNLQGDRITIYNIKFIRYMF